MKPLLIALGIATTVLCWGMYGNVLHVGQHALANDRMKPLICVGLAYMVIAILVPVAILASSGQLSGGWTMKGFQWSSMAGACGAFGALGIILALTSGGKPVYVMPIVFGGAPIVNVALAVYWSKAWKYPISPVFWVGLIMVSVGAVLVLRYAPKGEQPKAPEKHVQAVESPAAENVS